MKLAAVALLIFASVFAQEAEETEEHGVIGSSFFALTDVNGDGSWTEAELTALLEQLSLVQQAASEGSHAHVHHNTRDSESFRCHTAADIILDFDEDQGGTLSLHEAESVFPLLLLEIRNKTCVAVTTAIVSSCAKPTQAEAWGAGIGACIIISVISLLVVVVLPCLGHPRILFPVVAFGIGVLIGDAVLHIIPEVLGVAAHEHAGGEEEAPKAKYYYLGTMGCVLAGIFLGYILEKIVRRFQLHHHHKIGGESEHNHPQYNTPTRALSREQQSTYYSRYEQEESASYGGDYSDVTYTDTSDAEDAGGATADRPGTANMPSVDLAAVATEPTKAEKHAHGGGVNKHTNAKEVKSAGWLNLVADAMHNFVDGLIIGAAFTLSLKVGLATTLAVFFHELPQELGDAAILLKAGFSRKRMLFLNFLCQCTCILGGFIGLGVGSNVENATEYILPLVAGTFFYIALANMIPELMDSKRSHWGHSVLEGFCVLAGFGVMYGLVFANLGVC